MYPRSPSVTRAFLAASLLATLPHPLPAQAPAELTGSLVVFNAGSLGLAFKNLLLAFKKANPDVTTAQESSGSLEAARKLTELGKIPDVLAVADYSIIPKLLIPTQTDWYVTFANNSLVLAFRNESQAALEINAQNWYRILLRDGIRTGRADPTLDPAGYRTLMVWQLAEKYYRQPNLAALLKNASPMRYVRPKEADLTALLQLGEFDYIWTYVSLARANGFRWVDLPAEINLSDPADGRELRGGASRPARRHERAGRHRRVSRGADRLRAHRSQGSAASEGGRGVRAVRVLPGGTGDHRGRGAPADGAARPRRTGPAAAIFAGPFSP